MTMHTSFHRQQGAVLVVALVFLVILTMLGVTAMTGTTMEVRMATNARDLGIALNAAEAALRDAEWDIGGYYYSGQQAKRRDPAIIPADFPGDAAPATCNSAGRQKGLCRTRAPEPYGNAQDATAVLPTDLVSAPAVAGISLTGSPSVEYGEFTGAGTLPGVAVQPRYLIESLCRLNKPGGSIGAGAGCKYYRITARGFGSNPNSRVTLTEVYTVH